ncbi:hypothetical protein [Geminisphaera colitermitum]|uniref:hypothetical protein n=1 Tax=Geminisphaera colitermitum TaxID=1148786 RepID=UPI000158D410|nr:hypothetical protein [Geminisphaera colitermitum]
MGAKIAEWKADAKELTPEAKARLDKALVDFRAASKDLGNATASTWNTAKAKVRSSWDTLQKTIRDPNATCDDGSSCNDKAPEAGGAALEN